MFIWPFGVAPLSFAMTFDARVSGIVFLPGFAFYFFVVYLVKKRAAQSAPRAPR
jgi:hypothetical protein